LLVEYRGGVAVAWTVEAREYGTWQPHHRNARWLVPFWWPKRTAYLQNRVTLLPRSEDPPSATSVDTGRASFSVGA
jgi:hypothetical protein